MDWLMKMLGMQQNSATGGMPFGALGGSSGPAANNGMPMSGVGPGPSAPPAPVGPGVQGLWGGPGNVNTNIFGGARGGSQGGSNPAMGIAQSLINQQPIQQAQFAPMMPMGTMRG